MVEPGHLYFVVENNHGASIEFRFVLGGIRIGVWWEISWVDRFRMVLGQELLFLHRVYFSFLHFLFLLKIIFRLTVFQESGVE